MSLAVKPLCRKILKLTCAAALIFTSLRGEDTLMTTLFDFRSDSSSRAWPATNDSVMGGLSQGGARLSDEGMRFSGVLSLENNGGFSSVYENGPFDFSAFDGLRLRVKGDGRSYQLRLQTDARYRSWGWVSFSAEFSTIEGEWTEVFIPFEKLTQSWRGRRLSGYVFDPSNVQRIGLMLADKQPGEFELIVASIHGGSAPSLEPRNLD